MPSSLISRLVLPLALLLALSACRSSARAREHVDQGNQYFSQQKFSDAESQYLQAIQIDPDLSDAHYRLGLLLEKQQHPSAATKSFARAVDLDSRNLDARIHLGTLLVAATQYDDARKQAEAVLSSDPRNPAAHRLLGQIALQQMQYVPAENELQQSISLNPRDPQPYEDLGLAQLLDAEYGAAEKSFQAAVAAAPNDPDTYINLSNYYKGQSSPDRAEQILRNGIAKNPAAVSLPIAIAALDFERARPDDARRTLDQVELGQNFPDGRRSVAQFYLDNGNPAAALQRFRLLSSKDPRDLDSARKVAECLVQLGLWQQANSWIEQWTGQHDPKDVDFRLLRARSDLGSFRLHDAAAQLRSLTQDSPDAPAVYYYLAQVYQRQEEPAAAQQAYSDALRVQPGYNPAILGLGNISLQRGDSTVALNYASQIIATSFWLADAHILAGSAYLALNNQDQAQRAFELAVGLNPRSPEAQERLARVLALRGKFADAEKSYEASLALAPDYAPALNGLAELFVKQGKSKQATTRIDRQISSQPKAYQLLVAKAEFCIAQNDWPCAERSYKQVLVLNPYYVNGYLALAHVYAATNRPSDMIQQYETARAKFPDYLPTYIFLGQIYAYLGNFKQAQQTYQAALKADPNFYLAQMNLARLYADHGGPLADALQLAQQAKSAQPDDANVNDTLGWVYYRQGLYSSAVAPLEAAVARNSQTASFQFHLGMVYLAAGQSSKAQAPLQAALKLGLSQSDAKSAQDALSKLGS